MIEDDNDPLFNDCLFSETLKCPNSPALSSVYVLDVISEFNNSNNTDFALADLKPATFSSSSVTNTYYINHNNNHNNSNNNNCNINSCHVDVSDSDKSLDSDNNSKDHSYVSESTNGSPSSKSTSNKPYVKFESTGEDLSSPLLLTPVHKEICVKTDIYSRPSTMFVTNVSSQNLSVLTTHQRCDEWSQASESPGALSPDDYSDSSNGGSEYYTLSPAPTDLILNGRCQATHNINFTVRTRSKMQELALQQNLITNQDTKSNGQLSLSTEERRTLIQEGYSIPTALPLTKKDEEALKLVRRKIKNKLSAQESRRRRKEYIDTLEKRLHNCQSENNNLKRRVENLEQCNQTLVGQLRKLQASVGRSPSTGITLTAFILLFAILIPVFPMWPHTSISSLMTTKVGQQQNELSLSAAGSVSESSHKQRYDFHLHDGRVLTESSECEIPYSAEFFKHFASTSNQNECQDNEEVVYSRGILSEEVDGIFYNTWGFNNLSEDLTSSDTQQKSTKNILDNACFGLKCHQTTTVATDS